jgi:hypothetical protein
VNIAGEAVIAKKAVTSTRPAMAPNSGRFINRMSNGSCRKRSSVTGTVWSVVMVHPR